MIAVGEALRIAPSGRHFILHIPPKGAHLIRYYGWYSNKSRDMRRKAAEVGSVCRAEQPTVNRILSPLRRK